MTLKIKFPHLFLILIAIAPLPLDAMMERGGEEAKDNPVEEQAWDTANNSQEARITAAKNQRSYGRQTIIVEETIDTLNQPDDPQENSHPMNKISSTGETTPSLPENEHPLSHSSASAAALEGVPVSKTQNEGRTHFRLTQNGWEKRRRDANGAFLGDWEKTRELEPFKDKWTYAGESEWTYAGEPELEELQRAALASFGQAYNRADDIARKKSLYEIELQSLEPSSNRAKFIRELLPLFDLAFAYQNYIMARLQPRNEEYEGLLSENKTEQAATAHQAALRESVRLENIMTINSRPNKVERLIEQIEKVEAKRTTPAQSVLRSDLLNRAAENFRRATPIYEKLVQARLKLAKLIQASDKKTEEIDLVIQDQIEALKKDILKQESLAQLFYQLGKNYATTRTFHSQAYSSRYAKYTNDEGHCLILARGEVGRDQPRQAVIDYFLRGAGFSERAVAALDDPNDPNRVTRADYLNSVGHAFFFAGEEAQKDEPRQTVIDLFLRAADFKKRAAAALDKSNDPNRVLRATYLNSAGVYFLRAAMEARRTAPENAEIEKLLQEALEWQSKAQRLSLQPIEPGTPEPSTTAASCAIN